MQTRRLTAAFVATVMLFGAAAGCASSSDDDSSSGDNTESDSSNDNSSNDSGSNDDSSSSDLGDLGDLSDELGDLGDLGGLGDCFQFAIAYGSLSLSVLGAFDESAADELSAQLDELDSSVPDEVKDEWNTVRDAYEEWATVVADKGILSDEAAEASDALDSGDVADANDAITEWLDENCAG